MLSAAPVGAERAMGEPDPLVSGQLAAGRSWCLRRLGMDREWLQLEAASEVRACGLGVGGLRELRELRDRGGWEERRPADPACGEAPGAAAGLGRLRGWRDRAARPGEAVA